MTLINIHSFKDATNTPLLVIIDPQREYVHMGRPLGMEKPMTAIKNCQRLVAHARDYRIPIAFLRWSQSGKLFNPDAHSAGWIDGLCPLGSDMIFERAWPSAYASKEFCKLMEQGWGQNAAIAGFTGTMACLSTIVEGTQRQHRYNFVFDASHSHSLGDKSEAAAHAAATSIIALYARIDTTDEWIERTGKAFMNSKVLEGVTNAF